MLFKNYLLKGQYCS